MRVMLVWLIAAMLSIVSSGCMLAGLQHAEVKPPEAAPVKITFWNQDTNDQRKSALQDSIRSFNETHKSIQIVPYFYETESYKNKLRVAMISGKMPDIFYYWTGESFKRMVDSKVVADLTDMIAGSSELTRLYSKEALQSATYDNRIYGIPHSLQHVVVWYNKRIFHKYGLVPPKTWDGMMNAIQVLNTNGVPPIAVSGKERWPLMHWFAYLSEQIGGSEPFRRAVTREGDFTDPSFVEAGMQFHDLVKSKAFIPGFLGYDLQKAEKLFLSGEAAMYLQGDWVTSKLLNDDAQKDNMGYFPFPALQGSGDRGSYYGGFTAGWAVSSTTSDKQAAFEVLSYLLSEKERTAFVEATGSPSSVRHLPIDPERTSPAVYQYLQFIDNDPTGFFGYYDQEIDPKRAQLLLDAVVTLASEQDLRRQDITDILSQIK